MFKTHIAFALLFGLWFFDKFNGNKILFFSLLLISAAIVDIDVTNSKIGKKFWVFSKIFNFLFKHRTLFHSLLFAVILSFVVWFFFEQIWMPVFLGYSSHILLDSLTIEGINFIYPFKQLRLSGFIETGKTKELILFFLIIMIDMLLLFQILYY